MRDAVRKYLIDTAIGVAIAFIACVSQGIFKTESTVDTIRILCDGFFAAAMLLLAAGGLQWTYNGGVMDGLGFSFKMAFSRIRGDLESSQMTCSGDCADFLCDLLRNSIMQSAPPAGGALCRQTERTPMQLTRPHWGSFMRKER